MAKKRGKSRKSRKAKAKKQKFISKISRDGKISKKEGQKAAKKGISLRKIRNRNISDYRASVKKFDNRPNQRQVRNPADRRPTYEPLKIKRGAEQADRRRSARPSPSRPTGRKPTPGRRDNDSPTIASLPGPFLPDRTVNAPQVDFQPFEPDMPDFEAMFDEQAAQYQSQLEAMRSEQAAAAEEYRRQAEEQRRQFELQQRTMIGNEARAGQQANFQLGGAPGMKRGGTFGFRRRGRQLMGGINTSSPFGGAVGTAQQVFKTLNV